MELLEIEKIDYNTNDFTAVFDGLFKEGFLIEGTFDYDKEQVEYLDEFLGLRDYFEARKITFFSIEIYHDENKISINPRELKVALQKIQNELEDMLETYLNEG